ncbi:MAG: zinc-binding alcohol dehydrogenase family protein [Planctomycetota bacterium]|jgi:NADPH:quinone reductase-like Zn-dependent oxidoreductase
MPRTSEAWFLYAGDGSGKDGPGTLVRESFELPDLRPDEVLVEPLFGSWEANIDHAIRRDPLDICFMRGEEKMIPGNGSVVRVLEVGTEVDGLEVGQVGLPSLSFKADSFGYPILCSGYDMPGRHGTMATRLNMKADWIVPIPQDTRHSYAQWAAFSVRYPTAWSNWELAYGTFRLQVEEEEMSVLNVWGWGGGTSFAELDLARRQGHRAVMLSGNPHHQAQIAASGIEVVDRLQFGPLDFCGFKATPDRMEAYAKAEAALLEEVGRRTDGKMVQVFVEMIGEPVYRATLKALSRQGVLTTAGWKLGMREQFLRAQECIQRHQHIYTHFARRKQMEAAVEFAESSGWVPKVDERIYEFGEVLELAEDYRKGRTGLFPCYRVGGE